MVLDDWQPTISLLRPFLSFHLKSIYHANIKDSSPIFIPSFLPSLAPMLQAQCTQNNMVLPAHVDVAIWPTQGYINSFPNTAAARTSALTRVNASLSALNRVVVV